MVTRSRFNEKGLTLIELLAVIVILAIIAAIAVPSISIIINNQRDKAILSDIVQMLESSKMQIIDSECTGQVCEYSPTSNEINFSSNKFTNGKVDFRLGESADKIKIYVDIEPDIFKGSKGEKYSDFLQLDGDKIFTEKDLLDAINY